MTLFAIHHATLELNGRRILTDVSADAADAGFICIIGPNGAGKSSLLAVLDGLYTVNSGTVETLGMSVTEKTALTVRRNVGYIAQTHYIEPRQPITVFESVLCGTYGKLGFFKSPGATEKSAVSEALATVGLSALANRPVGQLSGGEQQKMAIARALVAQPKLLLMDEPLSALDWQAQREISRLIRKLHTEQHIPVVMVTHDLNTLDAGLCERVICVKSGQIFWQGSTQDAINPDMLSGLFDVPVTILNHQHRHIALV